MAKPTMYKDNTAPQNLLESLQTAILSNPYSKNEPIVYEFTQDRALLHQYYRLREAMYRKMFQTDQFKGEEDLHDKLSHILIARRGNLCLGGCRLTIREHDEMWNLPMESDDFKIRELFPHLPLDKARQCEISRFAIMEDSGDAEILDAMSKVMIDKVIDSDVHFSFVKSTLPLARNWRLIANKCGVKTAKICRDIEVPENPIHPDIKWYITLFESTSLCESKLGKPAEHAPILAPVAAAEAPQLTLVE